MPTGCACDPSRPTTADDCGPDETFVCRKAEDTDAEVVPFECACVPLQIDDCYGACIAGIYPRAGDGYECETTPKGDVLCGCAWVYLQ
jgi:hypothetical protein